MNFGVSKNIVKSKSFHRITKRYFYVLGIESSCDDSSAAVVNDAGTILGEGHFSQSRFHTEAGGIVPNLAYALHSKYLKSVVNASMKQSLLNFKDLDAIAVTVKPGLVLSLTAGLEYAKDLCTLYSKPMIPIHHMEAHALTARMVENVKFPFLVFLLSGKHCILAIAKSVDKFYTLGNSLQSSPGVTLDLIARRAKLKNLKQYKGLVGGAAIEAAARGGDSSKFKFNPSAIFANGRHCDFNFGGFLGAANSFVKNKEEEHKLEPDEVIPDINDLCAGVLLAMARHMCQNLEVAMTYINMKELLKEGEKCLAMSGGVACNQFFQKAIKKVCDHYGYKLVVPPAKLCTDNGAMVAWNGIERLKMNLPVVPLSSLSSVTVSHVYPFGEDISDDVKSYGKGMTFKFLKFPNYLNFNPEKGQNSCSDLKISIKNGNPVKTPLFFAEA